MRLALITQELEKRGEDLSAIKMGLLPLLRQIACGKLLPQIVVMYAGEPAAIRKIATFSLLEQEAIASGTKKFALYDDLPPVKNPGKKAPSQPWLANYDPDADDATAEGIDDRDPILDKLPMDPTGAAIYFAGEICKLILSGKVMKIATSDAAFAELLRVIGTRQGQTSTEELRIVVAKYLMEAGRSNLSDMAKKMQIKAGRLEEALNHLWFKKDGGVYFLTTQGRRDNDD